MTRPNWPFEGLSPLKYGFIMADCPWNFMNWSAKGEKKNAKHHYDCMDLESIKALPVSQLASGDCCLFLWATWPMLDKAFEVMSAWDFSYKTGGVWHKKTVNGKTAFGTGYRVRCASEPFLLGFIGNPKNSRSERNVIEGLVREHSRKPDEAYAWAERYLPGVYRVELFSRTDRSEWDSWGDETGKFNQGTS